MSNSEELGLNTYYNKFLTNLVLWKCLKRNLEKGNSFNNYEKLAIYQAKIESLLPKIQLLDKTIMKSCYPLLDDIALIKYFRDTVR